MNRFIKLVIFWMFAIALSVQGFAAAATCICGSSTSPKIIDLENSGHPAFHIIHHHDHALASTTDGSSGADSNHHHPDHNTHCKAGCCTTSLITATVAADLIPPPSIRLNLALLEQKHFPHFFPDGLERPPRNI